MDLQYETKDLVVVALAMGIAIGGFISMMVDSNGAILLGIGLGVAYIYQSYQGYKQVNKKPPTPPTSTIPAKPIQY